MRRLVVRLDPDAAALRTAEKNVARRATLLPDVDDQATVTITGPAVPLVRWYESLDSRARVLTQAGDPRALDALRFDLATSTFPCTRHVPVGDAPGAAAPGDADAGLRPSFIEAAAGDCRMSRPVQANITVPVETALGLSNEPGWLDGFGWLSAPTCRLLLVDAELRRVCVQTGTGQVVAVADHDVRPPPTPAGLRDALLGMVVDDAAVGSSAWRIEDQHDPSPPLRELVELRDRFCDGPTGTRSSATRCDVDHEEPHPAGPTAAWNLAARARRTHQLKHYGWTPLRTTTSTLWFSPAGQVVEVPRHSAAPPGVDGGFDSGAAVPDAQLLAVLDEHQLQPPGDERPPYVPASERPQRREWELLEGSVV